MFNYVNCGKQFAIYIYIKLLHCIPKTNTMLHQLYFSKKIKT